MNKAEKVALLVTQGKGTKSKLSKLKVVELDALLAGDAPKEEKKAGEITEFENKVLTGVRTFQKQGYNVVLKCVGRKKLVNKDDKDKAILDYVRENELIEIVASQSGRQARALTINK